MAAILRALDWEICVEYSFSHFGERGSVDLVAWDRDRQALLILEVKTELVDIQATLHAISIKERLVPELLAEAKGWNTKSLAVVLVLPDERGRRMSVDRHRAVFESAFPARTVQVKHWVEAPAGDLHGIWFLNDTNRDSAMRRRGGPSRVRRPNQRLE